MTVKWNNLNKIAAHVGRVAPFPDELPDVTVCDFDEMKNLCCVHRAGKLCSVDTVLVGKDGRLYFVEFKDSVKNPIASLKKKAFDSLSVFWMTLGREESIDSICSRAVFVYVKPDADSKSRPSMSFAEEMLFRDAGNLAPPRSRNGNVVEGWLNDFKVAKLYSEIEILATSDFVRDFRSRFYVGDEVSFEPSRTYCEDREGLTGHIAQPMSKVSLNRLLINDRSDLGCTGIDFCDDVVEAIDFRVASAELLRNRMYLPTEDFSSNRRDMLYVATALRHETLYTYHNWAKVKNPLARLANCIFDSAYLAAWICSPQATFAEAVGGLSAVIAYDEDFVELKRSSNVVWLQEFYDNYVRWFNGELSCDKCSDAKFGLECFVADCLYSGIVTTNQLPLSIK